ncbi:hypothetical protein FQN54_007615 [Arachnomyces sp. PD_36]|nr:hypothetical protein FQN54_007615 [Arachnomyces sp. PD_36]
MESSPLTLAHTHARNALLETRKSNPVAASEEHDLAAGEFATAGHSNSDREALRTLHLLEQHHKTLAEILRFQHENPNPVASSTPGSDPPTPGAQDAKPESPLPKTTSSPALEAGQQPPRLPSQNRTAQRDNTSSIASNLASARGIPSNPRRGSPVSPTISTQHAGAKMAGASAKEGKYTDSQQKNGSRASAPKQPWSPPTISPTEVTSHEVIPPEADQDNQVAPSFSDERFQRFYSTFEGLISKISAPLAFAGLPLGTETQDSARQKAPADTKLDRRPAARDRPQKQPDVSKLISRAALRAIQDTKGSSNYNNAAESFYVVPTTGGTISYAGILSRAEKEARRNSVEEDDDFVDARETPPSPEYVQNQGKARWGMNGRGSFTSTGNKKKSTKTMEELQMENQALKHLSDTLSKRLHMWEVNAQSSSMALQQSLRAMHHHQQQQGSYNNTAASTPNRQVSPSASTLGPGAGGTGTGPTLQTHPATAPSPSGTAAPDSDYRIKELEELIRRSEKEFERVGRENEKLKEVVARYRERWERLKEGARVRREGGAAKKNEDKGKEDVDGSPADD